MGLARNCRHRFKEGPAWALQLIKRQMWEVAGTGGGGSEEACEGWRTLFFFFFNPVLNKSWEHGGWQGETRTECPWGRGHAFHIASRHVKSCLEKGEVGCKARHPLSPTPLFTSRATEAMHAPKTSPPTTHWQRDKSGEACKERDLAVGLWMVSPGHPGPQGTPSTPEMSAGHWAQEGSEQPLPAAQGNLITNLQLAKGREIWQFP